MKKKILKMVLSILVLVVLVAVVLFVLIKKGILSNPILDTTDLVCVRTSEFVTYTEEEKYVFSFDKTAKVTEYKNIYSYIYPTLDEAKEKYDEMILYILTSISLNETENKIEIPALIKVDDNDILHNKTKEEIKKIYTDEYLFTCE